MVVPVDPPLVAHALAPALEDPALRVVAPYPGIDRNPLRFPRAGLADAGLGEDPLRPVEPAIRSPAEIVQGLVGVLCAPAIQDDLRLAVRHRVAVLVRDEKQIRRRADPNPAEADRDPAAEGRLVPENRPLLEFPIAVSVLEHQHLVLRYTGRLRIIRIFQHPQPPVVVDRVGDRLHDVGLAGDDFDPESRRQLHLLRGGGGIQRRGAGHRAVRIFLGADQCRQGQKEERSDSHGRHTTPGAGCFTSLNDDTPRAP